MNDFIKLLIEKRSVRKYKAEQISDEALQEILKAGIYAPNGGNTQMRHFTVIQNQDILKEFNKLIKAAFAKVTDSDNPFIQGSIKGSQSDKFCFYYGAPTLILISSDAANPNAIADCVCAEENILLAAGSLGLGSCYVNQPTWFDGNPDVRALLTKLGVPENHRICASASIGYSDAVPVKAIRNEDVVTIVK